MDNKQQKTQSRSNPLGTIRRVIWYALRVVLVISAVLGLCFAVFTEAMYVGDIYIVVREGMPLRADAILKQGAVSDLTQYFTEDFLNGDYMLYAGTYSGYTIESYDYDYEFKSIRVLPWGKTAGITYIERIPTIVGTPESEAEEGSELPPWTPVRYSISLSKVEGRWLISGLDILEENPQQEVLPTPDYSQLEG